MSDVFIYEFLFRGGPSSSPDDDTWHVILAREVEGIDGVTRLETTTALTPERAAEKGFSLSRILSEINQSAIEQAERYKREAEEANNLLEATKAELERTKGVAAPVEPAEEVEERSLLNKLTFGLIG